MKMDTQIEHFEIYDQDNQPLHYSKPRNLVHLDGDWHRTVQIFVINQQEQILCNYRSKEKDVFPLFWDLSIGGHITPGESYLSAAVREINEEIGIKIEPHELRFICHFSLDGYDETTKHIDREHATIFLYKTHFTTADFHFAADEIDAIEYFSFEDIRKSLLSEVPAIRFIPLKEIFIQILAKIEEALN